MIKILFLTFLITNMQTLHSEVKMPNYQFNLDSLEPFFPEKKIDDDQLQLINKSGLYLKKIQHENYHFDVLILINLETKIVKGMMARIPPYFLHDVFHQSLINKFKKQDKYFNENEHSVYQWNLDQFTITYEATCTITCFPLYLLIEKNDGAEKSFKSLFDLNFASIKK
jgi:hypothetical protein